MKFDEVKSDTLNLRVSPTFKLALKAAAEKERRSMVNMLEVLVANYCDSHCISISTKLKRSKMQTDKPHNE